MNTVKSYLIRKPAVALLLLLLGGCTAVGPNYAPPRPDLPKQWSETTGLSVPAGDAALNEWWTLFGDPILDSLVRRTIAANQDLRIAETRIREARAQRQVVGAAQSPALGASATATHSQSYANTAAGAARGELFQTGFDADWELDIFGRVRRSVEAADAAVASSVEARRDLQVSLLAEVARNYLELRGSQQRLALARGNLVNLQETVKLIEKRLAIGLSSELELEQAKNQLYSNQSLLPGFETQIAMAMHRLALLIGQPPQALVAELTPETALPATPPEIPVSLPSDLLRRRPDIRQAERDLAAATAQVGVATADLFPRFSLAALAGLESTSLSDLVSSGSRFWSIGPTVMWSLFDGGKIRAGIESSKAQHERARIGYEKTVLTALTEVEDALIAYNRESQTRQDLAAAFTAAQRASTLAREQFKLGLIDFLNVLASEYALRQSHDQLLQSDQRQATAMVGLFKALGGGWNPQAEDQTTPATSKKDATARY
jgi:NodT family efflux transporter outer membrane factor (OMF) lipoprotein